MLNGQNEIRPDCGRSRTQRSRSPTVGPYLVWSHDDQAVKASAIAKSIPPPSTTSRALSCSLCALCAHRRPRCISLVLEPHIPTFFSGVLFPLPTQNWCLSHRNAQPDSSRDWGRFHWRKRWEGPGMCHGDHASRPGRVRIPAASAIHWNVFSVIGLFEYLGARGRLARMINGQDNCVDTRFDVEGIWYIREGGLG